MIFFFLGGGSGAGDQVGGVRVDVKFLCKFKRNLFFRGGGRVGWGRVGGGSG